MANVLGFDGPSSVIFLVMIFYGVPFLSAGIFDSWYALIAIFGLTILAALVVVISNPKEYLTVAREF
jgi:hypothetical protein